MQAPSTRTVGAAGCDAIVKMEATAPVSTRWRETAALSSQLRRVTGRGAGVRGRGRGELQAEEQAEGCFGDDGVGGVQCGGCAYGLKQLLQLRRGACMGGGCGAEGEGGGEGERGRGEGEGGG